MEQEPDRIDLTELDPSTTPRWNAAIGNVVTRGLELRRLRSAVMRRGMTALALSIAAAFVLWFALPRRDEAPPREQTPRADILDWALREPSSSELLSIEIGGTRAN